MHADEIIGELLKDRFTYYPTVTRSKFKTEGRITDRIKSSEFAKDLKLESEHFNPQTDRVWSVGQWHLIKICL